jgi:hypothetical protein
LKVQARPLPENPAQVTQLQVPQVLPQVLHVIANLDAPVPVDIDAYRLAVKRRQRSGLRHLVADRHEDRLGADIEEGAGDFVVIRRQIQPRSVSVIGPALLRYISLKPLSKVNR